MCVITPTIDKPLSQLVGTAVRERIGFEFETDLAIVNESGAHFVYQTLLFERANESGQRLWSIIVDGIADDGRAAVLEFKTEPLATADELYTCVMDMAVFAFRIGERVKQAGPQARLSFAEVLASLDVETGLASAAGGVLLTGGSSAGAPQATIGIALCNVATALVSAQRFELSEFAYQERKRKVPDTYRLFLDQRVALTGLRGAAEFDGPTKALIWAQEMEQDIVEKREPLPGVFDEPSVVPVVAGQRASHFEVKYLPDYLKPILGAYNSAGLMALTLTYLNAGWYVWGRVKYSKSAFPVMLRNSFAALHSLLPRNTKFTADTAMLKFDLSRDQAIRSRVFRNGFSASLGPLLNSRVSREGRFSDDGTTDYGPSISDWLASIVDAGHGSRKEGCDLYDQRLAQFAPPVDTRGCDLLSRGSVRYSSTSLGSMAVPTISGVPFAIIEFREWPKVSLHPQLWISLATRLHEYYYLHSGACADFPSPWVNSPDLLWYHRDLNLKRSRWASRGFHYTPGNCLFDSTSFQLKWQYNLPYTAAALREMAANEIAGNPQFYLDFLAGDLDVEDPYAVVRDAGRYLAGDRNWEEDVADLAVAALANALDRAGADVMINVVGLDGKSIQRFGKGSTVVELLYNGVDHYVPYFSLPPNDDPWND